MSINQQERLFQDVGKLCALIEGIVNEMNEELDDSDARITCIGVDSSRMKFESRNEIPEKQKLIGFEHHLTEVKNRLLSHVSQVEVVPIVGMGGIGKTSLARAIFGDKTVGLHFDICLWVTVSQNYDVKVMLLALLGKEMDAEIRDIGERLSNLLYRKRYLIVMDDVWDSNAWDAVQIHLRHDDNRSRVLLTTRHQVVARCARPSGSFYELELVNEETSWGMLKHKVFGEHDCPPELVEIGKKIANGCCGLPLAIVVIAGVLIKMTPNKDSWEKIAMDVNEAIETNDGNFSKILGLSYDHLPHYLRPCFLYTSVFFHTSFDEDVPALLQLWSSERFLKTPINESKGMEEIAYECLEELITRNLITIIAKKYNGHIKTIGIHDLLRDLSIKKSKEENFVRYYHSAGAEVTSARIARFHGVESSLFSSMNQPHLRSVICFPPDKGLVARFESCKRLRILDAPFIRSSGLSSQFLELCHLRYINMRISVCECYEMLWMISKLVNLECFILEVIPDEHVNSSIDVDIWKLPKLRYFWVDSIITLPYPTGEISPLVNLSTLSLIDQFHFTDKAVKLIPNVKKLDVFCLLRPSSFSDYCFHNISALTHLENLYLRFPTNEDYDVEWCKQAPLLKRMTFPSSLKILKLEGGTAHVTWDDVTKILGSLSNLESLRFRCHAVHGDVWETNEGDFQNLKLLEISNMGLKCWKSDESNNTLSKLERLMLIACPNLTELPNNMGDIPNLKSIIVDDHQEAIVTWAEQIKNEQSELGNELLKVLVLPIAADLRECEETKTDIEDRAYDYFHRHGRGVWNMVTWSVYYHSQELYWRLVDFYGRRILSFTC